MKLRDTGGPAFPQHFSKAGAEVQGMTLRDYFAAKTLQGLLADSEVKASYTEFAAEAYAMADAMLKARTA